MGQRRHVRELTSNKLFKNMAEAERYFELKEGTLSYAMSKGGVVDSLEFVFEDSEQEENVIRVESKPPVYTYYTPEEYKHKVVDYLNSIGYECDLVDTALVVFHQNRDIIPHLYRIVEDYLVTLDSHAYWTNNLYTTGYSKERYLELYNYISTLNNHVK